MFVYYVYVLVNEVNRDFYVGYTRDLKSRVREHEAGHVSSTKSRRPLRLIFYEAYLSASDARRRERYLKTSKGIATLRMMLQDTLRYVRE